MNKLCQNHFNTGWNDTAHGILTWKDGCHSECDNALQWAIRIKQAALEYQSKVITAHNKAYYSGTIACVEHYQNTGRMERK